MTDGRDETPDSGSQMVRCIECSQFFPVRDTNDGELVPAGARSGGQCPECGGDEFEQVVLDPDSN